MKPNRQPRPPAFDRYKSLGRDDLGANTVISGAQLTISSADADGIKICNKDDQATKH